MTQKELLLYDMPTMFEFISVGWVQDILARYLAWKVNRKWARYQGRLELMRRLED